MWNERYAGDDYLFGTEPSAFLRREAARLQPGAQVLSIAEGEGRNAVWLAGQGHVVTAVEAAPNALAKAWRLAEARGVSVALCEADIERWDWAPDAFDAVLGIFIQFGDRACQDRIFAGMRQTLRPGGLVLLQGYAPRQVEYGTGGPGDPEKMYTEPLLRERFAGFEILMLRDYDTELADGQGHSGRSALVEMVARKPRPEA
ncbi:cyclopropane fatty-acyl-phospholipid synthase-like methyltransferase [Rhodovulum sulfidophilum]|uniref:SAM-dependent methyltransferase n=1 Tax=Rhodovulum sulfidophilum TaxID=35806 RepID=UPI0005A84016|nr:class I SAM-dependent methyltransferase [Rhodovulum sulfidophilum]ANB34590.1 SAM-dependent methyltransferase [Rhodovulum sulfidophilum DSM 1374]ANB38412.1 SAM-dependent methyltransferase [Rhodovulum sulfidophilum]MCW2303784.1 cyclopropane fatty-acyl-phospholipid synthase-like methyltransferase [Rhodovulum sulfidophilum]